MEIRTLKYLVSLAECGSFTAAAREHYVTQPAVSIQLGKLQNELGVVLFEVQGRTVRFTRAGEIVLDYAKKILNLERELLREIKDLTALERGSIALGTIDAASTYVLPNIFSRFRELYPGIDVHLMISPTRPLLEELASGRLDLVVGTLPIDDIHGAEIFPIFKEELVLIAPPTYPLAERRFVEPEALSEYPFISFHEESITRRIIERTLRGRGVKPRIAMAIDSPEVIKNLVASGLGLAVLPVNAVHDEIERGSVKVLRVRRLRLERRLGLIIPTGRYMSSTVKAFLGVLADGLRLELPERLCIPVKDAK